MRRLRLRLGLGLGLGLKLRLVGLREASQPCCHGTSGADSASGIKFRVRVRVSE